MKKIQTIAIIALLLFLNACSTISNSLKAGPIQNTEFAEQALASEEAALVAVPKDTSPFHRAWRQTSGSLPIERGAVPIYVSRVDVSYALNAQDSKGFHPAKADVEKLGDYLREDVERAFRESGFPVVNERPQQGLVIELALVELSATDIVRNVLGTALGAVVPGGGLVAIRSSGSTGIEGVVRDATTNKPVFVFADRERGKTALFSFNDFTLYSHARTAIDDWAQQLVEYCTVPAGTRVPDSSAVTLLQL